MIKFIFVRHGRDKNDKLTLLGRRQARLAVHELCYENVDRLFCSPKNRTVQTAKILAKGLGIKNIQIDERISEREKVDDKTENVELFNENYLNPNFSFKNPEGCKEYYDRVVDFLDEIVEKSGADETILIVGHSSMCYVMNAYFCKKSKKDMLNWIRIGNCSKICFEFDKEA